MNYEKLKSFYSDRISVREYSKREISTDDIYRIIDAAKYAPSSCNRQSIKVKIVKKGTKAFSLLSKANYGGTGFATEVPVLILVIVDLRSYYMPMEINYPISDGSLFAGYIMLISRALGLDTCWISWQASEKKKEEIFHTLNIEKYFLPVCVISVGYRKSEVIKSPREETEYYIHNN